MGNCLKTQLKYSVNNQELPPLGGMIFDVDDTTVITGFDVSSSVPVTFKVEEGVSKLSLNSDMSNAVSSVTINANQRTAVYMGTGKYHVSISDKSGFILFLLFSTGSIGNVQPIKANLSEFKYFSSLQILTLQTVNVGGDIATLCNGINLNSLRALTLTSNPDVYGEISDLLKSVWEKTERRSGTFTLTGLGNQKITLNGVLASKNSQYTATFTGTGFTVVNRSAGVDLTYTYSGGSWIVTEN